jgi:hypothetical protein
LTAESAGHSCAASAACAVAAAFTAAAALPKTAKNESPLRSISIPPAASNASRSSRLCAASASLYRSRPSAFSSRVEPSMSVNRKVTVPVGSG